MLGKLLDWFLLVNLFLVLTLLGENDYKDGLMLLKVSYMLFVDDFLTFTIRGRIVLEPLAVSCVLKS